MSLSIIIRRSPYLQLIGMSSFCGSLSSLKGFWDTSSITSGVHISIDSCVTHYISCFLKRPIFSNITGTTVDRNIFTFRIRSLLLNWRFILTRILRWFRRLRLRLLRPHAIRFLHPILRRLSRIDIAMIHPFQIIRSCDGVDTDFIPVGIESRDIGLTILFPYLFLWRTPVHLDGRLEAIARTDDRAGAGVSKAVILASHSGSCPICSVAASACSPLLPIIGASARVGLRLRVPPHIAIGVHPHSIALHTIGREEHPHDRVIVAGVERVQPRQAIVVLARKPLGRGEIARRIASVAIGSEQLVALHRGAACWPADGGDDAAQGI